MTLSLPPRGLDARTAAAYCGVSVYVLRKHGPAPLRIGSLCIWDLRALDAWLDSLGGKAATDTATAAERAMLEALR